MRPITQFSQLDPNGTYTYADYLTWKFEGFVELIRGKVLRPMSAPTSWHQQYSINLAAEIRVFLKGKPCRVYAAPNDVRLTCSTGSGDAHIQTVVQPDICVVCDLSKIDTRGCLGAPTGLSRFSRPATWATTRKRSSTCTKKTGCVSIGLQSPA